MTAGWNIRVATFNSEGKPRIVRNFVAYESDEKRAFELVGKRVPVTKGERAEAVAEVAENEFVGSGMRPGDVRRLGKKADLDEGQRPCLPCLARKALQVFRWYRLTLLRPNCTGGKPEARLKVGWPYSIISRLYYRKMPFRIAACRFHRFAWQRLEIRHQSGHIEQPLDFADDPTKRELDVPPGSVPSGDE